MKKDIKAYSEAEIIKMLRGKVTQAGNQKAFAEIYDVSEQFISDVLRGRTTVTDKILNQFGLKRIVAIVEINGAEGK
jgi:hypothetical protein